MVISCRPCYSSCFCASASHFATHLYHRSFHAVSDLMLHLVVTNVWAFLCWGSPRVIQWIQTGHNAQPQMGITMFFQLSWSWLQYCQCHSFVMSLSFILSFYFKYSFSSVEETVLLPVLPPVFVSMCFILLHHRVILLHLADALPVQSRQMCISVALQLRRRTLGSYPCFALLRWGILTDMLKHLPFIQRVPRCLQPCDPWQSKVEKMLLNAAFCLC